MKTKFFYSVVLAVAVLMTGVFGTANAQTEATNNKKYVNVIRRDGKPAEKTVYRALGNELFNVKQYLYKYDTEDRVSQIDISYWNEDQACWELRYSTVYTYKDGTFEQQMREFRVGTLHYEVIADAAKIREIMMY